MSDEITTLQDDAPEPSALSASQDDFSGGFAAALSDDEPAPETAAAGEPAAPAEKPAAPPAPPAAKQAEPAGALAEALEAAKGFEAPQSAPQSGAPQSGAPASTKTAATASTDATASTPPAAKPGQPPAAGAPALLETVSFGGKIFNVKELLAGYGDDVGGEIGALATVVAQGAIAEQIQAGALLTAAQAAELLSPLKAELEQARASLADLRAEQEYNRHLSQVSRLAGADVRALLDDAGQFSPEMAGWLKAQPTAFSLMLERGTAEQQAKVVKAYFESKQLDAAKTIDAARAEEHARKKTLHKATVRDGAGRFAEDTADDYSAGFHKAIAD